MTFAWLRSKSERDATKLIRKDRQHLEARTRRFLKGYLRADDAIKPRFYRVVEDAVERCLIDAGTVQPSPELDDSEIAMATSNAATNVVMETIRSGTDKAPGTFRTDAYATVAIAYRRAAGIYADDQGMQELGTAAVHLLTMATSYVQSQDDDLAPSQALEG
jgi:hypothetical protein